MSAWGMVGKLDIRVDTEDAATTLGGTGDGSLNIDTAFTVNNMEFDVPFLAVGVRGLSVTGAGANFDYNGDGVVDLSDVDLDSSGVAGDTKEEKLNMGFANVNMDVYKGNGLGASGKTDVLRIDVNDVIMDVNVAGVLVGGTSIGSFTMDNLHVQNTRMAIYGH